MLPGKPTPRLTDSLSIKPTAAARILWEGSAGVGAPRQLLHDSENGKRIQRRGCQQSLGAKSDWPPAGPRYPIGGEVLATAKLEAVRALKKVGQDQTAGHLALSLFWLLQFFSVGGFLAFLWLSEADDGIVEGRTV